MAVGHGQVMPDAAPERALWHPVLAADALRGDRPQPARLLGTDLAVWRAADGTPRAFTDRCPHRGTRFTLGRVVDGEVECAYHGWRFADDGRCTLVPADPGFRPPAGHTACRFDAVEAHGLVWVRLAAGEAPVPAFDAEADPRLRKLICGPYAVATSAPRIVENFLDLAHFGFVHEHSLGDRAHAALADYAVAPTSAGFVATGCRAWQPRSHRLAAEGSWVDYCYELTAPYTAQLVKLPRAQDGHRDVIGLFVCPVEPEHSVVWFRLAVTDADSSDQELRDFQDRIFGQDRPILESQQPARLPVYQSIELQHAADRSSSAYRRHLRARGITFGTC